MNVGSHRDMSVKVLGTLHANMYPYFLSFYAMLVIVQGTVND